MSPLAVCCGGIKPTKPHTASYVEGVVGSVDMWILPPWMYIKILHKRTKVNVKTLREVPYNMVGQLSTTVNSSV